jgi:transcriptional repressor NrdR
MRCLFCKGLESSVIDSRLTRDGDAIRRRRECRECERRFTTYERVEEHTPLIIKKDGRREPFDRAKLTTGLVKACEKRPISIHAIETFVAGLGQALQERGDREIPSDDIGSEAMAFLRRLDPIAYLRFASVYRAFSDISEFMSELKDLVEERSGGASSHAAAADAAGESDDVGKTSD